MSKTWKSNNIKSEFDYNVIELNQAFQSEGNLLKTAGDGGWRLSSVVGNKYYFCKVRTEIWSDWELV